MRIVIGFLLLVSSQLYSLEYGIIAKHEGTDPITKFSLYSERCSGSFYLSSLLFSNVEQLEPKHFCHKHFPPWFTLPRESYLGPKEHYTFEGTDDCLFVIIFREPYDWARSFNKDPWHGHPSMYKLPFSVFIRKPWELNPNDKHVLVFSKWNALLDKNPETQSSFNNIFELRTAKIRNMLMIKDRAKHVYYVNYEIVRDKPQEVLKEIANTFNLKLKPNYEPVVYYKGWDKMGVYQPKEYQPISDEDLIYINSQLDESLENQIGYKLKK